MKDGPRNHWVPQNQMHYSSDECLSKNPESPAIAVMDMAIVRKMSKHFDEMLDFIKKCGEGQYSHGHSDRIARDLVKKIMLDI